MTSIIYLLVFGELFGAGVFVTTVVAGSVAITKPFKVKHRKECYANNFSNNVLYKKKHKKRKRANSDILIISTFFNLC